MVILKLPENLLHDRFPEQDGLCMHLEPGAVPRYGCHFTIIQIHHLSMTSY